MLAAATLLQILTQYAKRLWNYERQGVCLKPQFSLAFRESLWCFPLYNWAFQHSEKEVQDPSYQSGDQTVQSAGWDLCLRE